MTPITGRLRIEAQFVLGGGLWSGRDCFFGALFFKELLKVLLAGGVEFGHEVGIHGFDDGLKALLGFSAFVDDGLRGGGEGGVDKLLLIGIEIEPGAIFGKRGVDPLGHGECLACMGWLEVRRDENAGADTGGEEQQKAKQGFDA
jgi:hypothetical protein